ncbi:glycosyltransferase [Planococcus sp. SIMBA_143]
MKVVFFGMNLNYGGGKIFGINIVKEWLCNLDKNQVFAVLPHDKDYLEVWNQYGGLEDNVWFVNKTEYSRLGRLNLERSGKINNWLRKKKISHILNATNLPLKNPPCTQVLFLHRAFLIAPINLYGRFYPWKKIMKIYFEKNFFKLMKKNVDKWVVQSEFMKENLNKELKVKDSLISVIPSGSAHEKSHPLNNQVNPILKKDKKEYFDIIVPTKSYDHKRLITILDILNHYSFKKEIRFITTLDKNIKKDRLLLDLFSKEIKSGKIKNLGFLSPQELHEQYLYSDAMYMPTLIESYGLPFVEAMYYSLPVITFNTPIANEICGDAAIYFEEDNISSLVQEIYKLVKDEDNFYKRRILSYKRYKEVGVTWERSAILLYNSIIDG